MVSSFSLSSCSVASVTGCSRLCLRGLILLCAVLLSRLLLRLISGPCLCFFGVACCALCDCFGVVLLSTITFCGFSWCCCFGFHHISEVLYLVSISPRVCVCLLFMLSLVCAVFCSFPFVFLFGSFCFAFLVEFLFPDFCFSGLVFERICSTSPPGGNQVDGLPPVWNQGSILSSAEKTVVRRF